MSKFLSILKRLAQQEPHKIALIGEHSSMTYGQLLEQVDELAKWLQSNDINRAGLWGENSIAWVVADLAALKAKVTLVPLPQFFSKMQLKHIIQEAQFPCLIMCGDAEKIAAVKDHIVTPIENIFCDLLSASGKKESLGGIRKITFTSDTTGTPKGVCLNEAALENVIAALAQRIHSSQESDSIINRHFTLLPLSTLLENIAGVY